MRQEEDGRKPASDDQVNTNLDEGEEGREGGRGEKLMGERRRERTERKEKRQTRAKTQYGCLDWNYGARAP